MLYSSIFKQIRKKIKSHKANKTVKVSLVFWEYLKKLLKKIQDHPGQMEHFLFLNQAFVFAL